MPHVLFTQNGHPQQLWHVLAYARGAAQVFDASSTRVVRVPTVNRTVHGGQCTAAMRLAGHGAAFEASPASDTACAHDTTKVNVVFCVCFLRYKQNMIVCPQYVC